MGQVAGTYTWSAHYSGDGNNVSANDQGGTSEQTVVSAANPSVTTTASGAVTLGTAAPTLSESAVLFGGYLELGRIIFRFTGPGGFSYTQTDTVSGNGTYTAGDTLPTMGQVAGTYTWSARSEERRVGKEGRDQGWTSEQKDMSAANTSVRATDHTFLTDGTV